MRRIARRLPTFCSALSLLTSAAACVLWARSYTRSDLAHVDAGSRWVAIATCRGTLSAAVWLKADHDPDIRPRYKALPAEDLAWIGPRHRERAATRWGGLGFWYLGNIAGTTPSYVPLWLVAASAATLPLMAAHRGIRRQLRRTRCLCPSCGYDLRANPERCPECGTAAALAGGGNRAGAGLSLVRHPHLTMTPMRRVAKGGPMYPINPNDGGPVRRGRRSPAVSVALALLAVGLSQGCRSRHEPRLPAMRQDVSPATRPALPFEVFGRVTDEAGAPVEGAEVWVNCGVGTLWRTGEARTDAEGRYRLPFDSAVKWASTGDRSGIADQFGLVSAHKRGYSYG